MASIINSDNGSVSGSAGLKFTSGDDGVLQIQNSGTTAVTISSSGIATFAQPSVNPVPAFSVELLNDQAISANTDTLVEFDTTNFDFGSYWDGTNFRYIPQIAGYYQFNATLRFTSNPASQVRVTLAKNGTYIISSQVQVNTTIITPTHVSVSHLMYCNGSTDYVDIIGRSGGASGNLGGTNDTTIGGCHFSGFLVRAT